MAIAAENMCTGAQKAHAIISKILKILKHDWSSITDAFQADLALSRPIKQSFRRIFGFLRYPDIIVNGFLKITHINDSL